MAIEPPCTCTTLRRLARTATLAYDEILRPTGLRVTQLSVLRTLLENGPLSVTRLASEAGLDRSTMGRNLDPLERMGFVVNEVGKNDQRERVARLTAEGAEAVEAALPYWHAAQAEISRRISTSTVSMLTRQLEA